MQRFMPKEGPLSWQERTHMNGRVFLLYLHILRHLKSLSFHCLSSVRSRFCCDMLGGCSGEFIVTPQWRQRRIGVGTVL